MEKSIKGNRLLAELSLNRYTITSILQNYSMNSRTSLRL